MSEISDWLARNRDWARRFRTENPQRASELAAGQAPSVFWIGCSDSRLDPCVVMDLQPGDVFVHRNIANTVPPSDLGVLSAVQFAVGVLRVSRIVVCGHYGCGGIDAALGGDLPGPLGQWVDQVRESVRINQDELDSLDGADRHRRLVELHVCEQIRRLGHNRTVRQAWEEGSLLELHGWVLDVADFIIRPLCTQKHEGGLTYVAGGGSPLPA